MGVMLIKRGGGQCISVPVSLRKSGYPSPRVAVEHAPGTVTVKHLLNLLIPICLSVNPFGQRDRLALFQLVDQTAPFGKLSMLGFELIEIGEARRIDQLQPVKVAS